uniref:G-protein coupled receptors family 1 profile domain-containing protein n=1 Tax=Plectus sambesii TaxID=2011161 RepID=A0A914URP4_9BILA
MKLRFTANSTTEDEQLRAQQRKRERSFLVQALIICMTLELEILGFTYMPELAMAGFVDWYWITLFIGWIIILNSSINPIIYVVFNQSIRDAFKSLIHGVGKVQPTRTVELSRSRSSQPVVRLIPSTQTRQIIRSL